MASQSTRSLDAGYSFEADTLNEQGWNEALQQFDDANIFQTWAYAEIHSARGNISHVVVRKHGEIVALAIARVTSLPLIGGVAYVLWGPVWRRSGSSPDPQVFRQALRALRNHFSGRRGLTVRLAPMLFEGVHSDLSAVLADEGFSAVASAKRSRTLLMDLSKPTEALHNGMAAHWKRELKVAEKKQLDVADVSAGGFDEFIEMYKEMVSRKGFSEPNDIYKFKKVQSQLPDGMKMKVLLCKSGSEVCSGVIASAIGKNAIYLFGATSTAGMKSRGSYLLQWRLIQQLQGAGVESYDLNGIDPVKNPGTFKFKHDLAGADGADVTFLGRFDAHRSRQAQFVVGLADLLRARARVCGELVTAARGWMQGWAN
jgi:lipid II:glycine glycyltransferase (peptidoglycan interpeptide bridge formation enzyme)